MVFTTIIAVMLGAGRFAVLHLSPVSDVQNGIPLFIFLACAAIIVTLPLILASLLPRFAIPAVAVALLLAGILTAFEIPLLNRFQRVTGGGPDTLHIVFINGFTSAWVLIIVLIVRTSGYRFGTAARIGPLVD